MRLKLTQRARQHKVGVAHVGVDGIGIPGMPTNAPGMGEPDGRPLEVLSFNDDGVAPFATL